MSWASVFEGSPEEGYQATGGWRLKFASAMCRVRGHASVA